MAFGDLGPSYLPTSHISSEIEQPTDAKSLMAPYTGDPRQMLQFLMDPSNQQHMAQFGVHFNPDTIRESPFFSQHFMQQHPQLGGRLSGAMAGAMSVPEAPMVSGAGSGISRALQGAFGGPEMLKQYQARQLQGPMQQVGMQIPSMEFQRKQRLLSSWQQMMGSSEDARKQYEAELERKDREEEGIKQQLADQKGQQDLGKIEATRPTVVPGYGAYVYNPGAPAQPGLPSQNPALQGKPATPGGWEPRPLNKDFSGQMWSPGRPGPGGAAGKNPRGNADQTYANELAKHEAWLAQVQGGNVPAMGQEGSQASPPRYWKDLNPQEQQNFWQQQQQYKQQLDNLYHSRPGVGGSPYNYNQQQLPGMMAPGAGAKGGQQGASSFNPPPQAGPQDYEQQPGQPPPGIDPADWQTLQQFPEYTGQ